MKSYIFLILSVFSFQMAFSQTGNVLGNVKAIDGTAIEHVKIQINEEHYKTDKTGQFVISNLAYGTYSLTLSKEGFKTEKFEIQVKQAENQVNLVLKANTKDLDEVTILATRSANEKAVEIGKIPIKPFDLPQSTSIVDREVIEQQQSQQLSDVLKNTNGVYIMGNTGGYQEEIGGRGFNFGSSNTFKNGVRFNNAVMPETSSLERMEILKGSTAILFGNVAAGGILNLVTKKPMFEKGGEVTMRAGSYEYYKPSIDVYGSVNKNNTIAYRVNSSYQNSKSFRDQVKAERFYVNPSLLFLVGKKTEILVEGDYLKDDRTADFGVGAIDYQLIDIPRNTFIGFNWSYMKTEQKSFTATITHNLNKNWQIKSTNAYQGFNNDLFSNVRPNSSSKFIKTDGTWVRGVQRTEVQEEYYLSQLDLTGKFNTGKVKHTLLFGADVDQYFTMTTAYNGISTYDTVNVFNIEADAQRNDIPSLTKKTDTKTPTTRTGVYVQDLIAITEKIKVLAGVRFSYLETESNIFTFATQKTTTSSLYDHAFSPRFGLIYQPIKTMSIFTSYSNSFTPNTGVDIEGNALEPSIIDQYEVGVKNDLFGGLLTANVTAYQITNSAVAQMVLENADGTPNSNTNIKELAGEITSQGLEVDVNTKQWKGLSVIAGYSFNDTKYTESNIYAVGSVLRYQPRNTANLSLYYEVQKIKALKGFNVGISGLYFGERFGGRLTRLTVANDTYRPIPLPEYTTLDASLGYTRNNITIRFKISNIFNVLSYNVHDDNSVNPIAPRMFMSTLSLKL